MRIEAGVLGEEASKLSEQITHTDGKWGLAPGCPRTLVPGLIKIFRKVDG